MLRWAGRVSMVVAVRVQWLLRFRRAVTRPYPVDTCHVIILPSSFYRAGRVSSLYPAFTMHRLRVPVRTGRRGAGQGFALTANIVVTTMGGRGPEARDPEPRPGCHGNGTPIPNGQTPEHHLQPPNACAGKEPGDPGNRCISEDACLVGT